jgi:pimeloyl-ACP methyl ester carboxylesterase
MHPVTSLAVLVLVALAPAVLRAQHVTWVPFQLPFAQGTVEAEQATIIVPEILDIQLQRLAAFARADSAIGSLVPDLVAMHRQTLARLEREPVRVTLNDPITRQPTEVRIGKFGYQFILMRDMGDTNDWPILPGLIARTASGDYGLLTQFAARRWATGGSGASLERSAMVQREARSALFGNAMNAYTTEMCTAIGAADLGAEFRSRIWSSVPTLFISGTLDNQTPPHQAEEVRWGFANGVHVIVEHAGHESTLDKAPVQDLLVRFLAGEAVADQRVVLPRPKFRGPGG